MTIFEKIVNREIPAYIIYEDDLALAFLDISQATKGHTLVIPKKTYADIFDIPDDVLAHLIKVVKKITVAIDKAYQPLGINLLNNNRETAGQTVFHFHFHIIPRYTDNDVRFGFNNNMNKLTSSEYEERLLKIKNYI